ncbi:MAG: hypothetical protein ACI9ZV_000001, partial [Candidatus Azotimanducaceae bacterium]
MNPFQLPNNSWFRKHSDCSIIKGLAQKKARRSGLFQVGRKKGLSQSSIR